MSCHQKQPYWYLCTSEKTHTHAHMWGLFMTVNSNHFKVLTTLTSSKFLTDSIFILKTSCSMASGCMFLNFYVPHLRFAFSGSYHCSYLLSSFLYSLITSFLRYWILDVRLFPEMHIQGLKFILVFLFFCNVSTFRIYEVILFII